jgi:putative peptidoglycan lipid II flippase
VPDPVATSVPDHARKPPVASAETLESDDAVARLGRLASAVRATGGVTLLSRLGGLIRDVIIGRVFGDQSAVGSAFNAAFAIPNMFRRLFGEGALSAAFIPAYTDAQRESAPLAAALASITMRTLGLVTATLTLIIEVVLLLVLLLGTHDPERAISIKLIMIMLPFMPLICMVAILAGMLQVHGKFGPAASGPIILNAFIIIVGILCLLTGTLAGPGIATALGLATVLSGATQLYWFLRLLRPHVKWTRDFAAAEPRARTMLRKFVPVAIGLGTLQLNTFIDTLLAMWPIWVGPTMLGFTYQLDDSSNFILGQTQRFYQFPLGVFGIAIATAVFPLLSRYATEPEHFRETLQRGLRLSVFIGIPATVGLMLVRFDAIGVLYGHGSSGWKIENIQRAASVLNGFALGVWAYSINHVLTRAFYAKGDTATPMRIAIAMVLLNFTLNLTLMWSLREAGLAWATSLSAIVQAAVLAVVARRRLLESSLIDAAMLRGVVRIIVASVLMAFSVILAQFILPAGQTWWNQFIRVLVSTAVGGGAFLAAARLLPCHELRWLLQRPSSAASDSRETSAASPSDVS